MTIALTITGLATTSPTAQAVDKPAPVTQTIDYIITSSTGNTSYVSTADLATMTTMLSDAWRRLSRGVITEMKTGRVFTIPNIESEWTFCNLQIRSSIIATTLGYSPSVYDGQPNGRQLVVLGKADETSSCGWSGSTQVHNIGLSMGGFTKAQYSNPSATAGVLVHELGHVFGLKHAGAVLARCIPALWDGPFAVNSNDPGPGWCPVVQAAQYNDSANIMGYVNLNADINGYQKYQLGLIQPGTGAIQVTAASQEQLFTIHDAHTTNLDLPQTILMTADDPDGAGPCTAPLYNIDYDPKLGGVKVLRVATGGDCGMDQRDRGPLATVAWTTAFAPNSSRSYFLPGESRLTQSGKVQVKVVSANPTAGTATVSIRRTDTPGVTTLQVTAERFSSTLSVVANGGQDSGVVTTNQSSWSASSDQSWVTVTPSGTTGQTVSISVAPNLTTLERTAVVTVRAGTVVSRLNVIQAAGDHSIGTDCGQSTSSYCSWDNTSTPITGSLETAGDKDWLKFTVPSTGSYAFTVSRPQTGQGTLGANLYTGDGTWMWGVPVSSSTYSVRVSAYLTAGQPYFIEIMAWGYTGNYTVMTARTVGTVTIGTQTLTAEPGGNIGALRPKVWITTDGVWTAKAPPWVIVTPASGSNPGYATFTIAGNGTGVPRTESVTFTVDGQNASVSITQSPANDDCKESAATTCAWPDLSQPITKRIDFYGDKDWIKITPSASGTWVFKGTTMAVAHLFGSLYSADGTLEASEENPEDRSNFKVTASLTAGRTYYLEAASSLENPVGDYTVTATRETGPIDNLSVSPTAVSAPAAGGDTQTVGVTASGDWTATGPSWVTITPASGKGSNPSVRLTATANGTGSSRTETVTFTSGAKTATVTVTQAADTILIVSPPVLNAAAGGGTYQLRITTNTFWGANSPILVSLAPFFGTGDSTMTVQVTPNPGATPRTIMITIHAGTKVVTVPVTQPG